MLQLSLLDPSLNVPRPVNRNVWDAEMTVYIITLGNNARYKVLFAQHNKNCGDKNRFFGQVNEEIRVGLEAAVI